MRDCGQLGCDTYMNLTLYEDRRIAHPLFLSLIHVMSIFYQTLTFEMFKFTVKDNIIKFSRFFCTT